MGTTATAPKDGSVLVISIISLVAGILCLPLSAVGVLFTPLLALGIVGSLAAIGLGVMGLLRSREQPGETAPMLLSVGGIATGAIGCLVQIVMVAVVFVTLIVILGNG